MHKLQRKPVLGVLYAITRSFWVRVKLFYRIVYEQETDRGHNSQELAQIR